MAYGNGRLPARALAEIKSHKKHYNTTRKAQPKAAEAFDRLDAAFYKKFGKHIYITDSYRSLAEQVDAKKRKGAFAATPGTSNHGWGLALDLGSNINVATSAEHKWMDSAAKTFGWANPWWAKDANPANGQFEPWHWEYDAAKDRSAFKKVKVTGAFDKATIYALQRVTHRPITAASKAAGRKALWKAIQQHLNAHSKAKTRLRVDGVLGTTTIKALQTYLRQVNRLPANRPRVDGLLGPATIKAWQRSLNAKKF